MSANIEYALITRAAQDHDFGTLEKQQITESFFQVPEMRAAYQFMRECFHHPLSPGTVPTIDMLRHRFPAFQPAYAPDSVPMLCQALRHSKVQVDILNLSENLRLLAEKNPYEALASLKVSAQTISSMAEVGQDLSMAGAAQELWNYYNLVASQGGLLGIPFPWQQLNEATQGMKANDFIVIYGRPKSMKTWISIFIACYAYRYARRRVLFYTREMAPIQIARRVAASLAGVNYTDFVNGTLQPEIRDYVFMILRDLLEDEKSAGIYGHQPCFLITSDKSPNGGGVTWLQSKIREVQPDLVIVDGMYLMKDDRSSKKDADWKQLTNVTRDIKQTAMEFQIPIIGVTQANREAENTYGQNLTELAYSDSIGMDADAVFRIKRLIRQDDTTGGLQKTELIITAPGLREGKFGGIVIAGEPCTNFSFQRVLADEDMVQEEKGKGYGHGKKAGDEAAKPNGYSGKKTYNNVMDPSIAFLKK